MEYLIITLIGSEKPAWIHELGKLITHCRCHIAEARVTPAGIETVANLLLTGSWNALAKFETHLVNFIHKHALTHLSRRTHSRPVLQDHYSYYVYVTARESAEVIAQILQFFVERSVLVQEFYINTYKAPFNETLMSSITLTISFPTTLSLADLRENFMVLCDQHNLDAVMEPQKN